MEQCQQVLIFQSVCSNEDSACLEQIQVDTSECLFPCEGIFIDVKRQAPEINKEENHQLFLKKYKIYKQFFELSPGRIQ